MNKKFFDRLFHNRDQKAFEQTTLGSLFSKHSRWIELYETAQCGPGVQLSQQEYDEFVALTTELLDLHNNIGMEWMYPHWLSYKTDLFYTDGKTKH